MNRDLRSNLEDETPNVLVENGSKKQGRGMFGLLLMVVMMMLPAILGSSALMAQNVVSEGLYYIGSRGYNAGNTTTNYYLCPTEEWYYYTSDSPYYTNSDNGQPFMTTFQCRNGENGYDSKKALWVVKESPTAGYFYVIHVMDGKYLTYNDWLQAGDKGRMRVHLEATADGENALFQFTYISTASSYDFTSKNSGPDNNRKYLNPTGARGGGNGNQPSLQATNARTDGPNGMNVGGILGLYTAGSSNDNNSKWYPESTLLTAPTISDVDLLTSTITVSDVNDLPIGYNIRYTVSTNGTAPADPTATSPIMTAGSYLVEEECIIKAVVEHYGVVLTEVATSGILTPSILAAPTVTDNCDNTFELSCSNSAIAVIYYNLSTDGTEPAAPDASSTQYQEGSPVSFGLNYYLKAISILDGTIFSTVTSHQFTQVYTEAPTITLSAITATITAVAGATIYYTTNGTDPTTSSSIYSGPVTISESSDVDIRAIAQSPGEQVSCVTRATRPAEPTLTVTDGDCTTTTIANLVTLTAPDDGRTLWYTYTAGNNSPAPNPSVTSYIQYTEPVSVSDLDGSNTYYTFHAYAQSSDGLYNSDIISESHQMKTTGKPELTPPSGSNPVVGISGGVFGDVAICSVGGNTTNVPLESDGTAEYTIPSGATGILTVAFKHGNWPPSCEATYTIPAPPATPTWSQECDNRLSLSTTSPMAIIHYTTDGTEALVTSPTYTEGCLYNITLGTRVRARAFEGFLSSGELDYTYQPEHVAVPQFFVNGTEVTISGPSGTTIRYTSSVGTTPGVVPSDPADPTSSSTLVNGPIIIAGNNIITVFKAIAIPSDPDQASCVVRVVTREGYSINETANLSLLSTNPDKFFFLFEDIDASGFTGTVDNFTGVLDGNYHTISNLSVPLFNTITSSDPDHNAAVLDVMFKDVNISTNGNAGVIANTATGYTRIYNCGILPDEADGTTTSSISGTANVGGLVGELSGTARVINCFSYANITGGTYRGGIVGNNNVTTASTFGTNGINTMIMNCMFYGDISSGGTVIAPIYGGIKISNSCANNKKGLNNYNYFRFNQKYVEDNLITDYNCALGAQDRFLVRFEFFRNILNSNRELAMWYVSGSVADAANEMGHWVLDKSVAPYPILKEPGQSYPSLINPDAAHAIPIDPDNEHRNEGRKLGELTVKITAPSNWTNKPDGAGLVDASYSTTGLTLNITDKDEANYNFNYKKIQLPYYNEVGTNNYTGNKVVTGWKITEFTGGTPGSFTTGNDVVFDGEGNIVSTPYNFVDRACTNKDKYSVSSRVFNQGAYYEVPDGVTAITIEPYWATCVYLSDAQYDVVYNGGTAVPVPTMGDRPTYFNNDSNQTVYNSFTAAHDRIIELNPGATGTVYDYAIVLVGNYHLYMGNASLCNDAQPFTFMSADYDHDNEPDNCFFYEHYDRQNISPVCFDFVNIVGIGMAQKEDGVTSNFQPGIFFPKGWFEITNTVLIHFGQFEYADKTNKTRIAPLILQGGIYEQFVSARHLDAVNTNYILVGGNAWFKNFANGCHTNKNLDTPKPPISVSGGDYEHFYLSGIYRPEWGGNNDNAECYIDGGRFGEVAGAGRQVIKGDVTWLINAADIDAFYGGGINDANPIGGNIRTTISNSWVTEFCGGPKFGNVQANKIVKTTATDCHFGNFFGAGYGGTALNRIGVEDYSFENVINHTDWNNWVNTYYKREYQVQQLTHVPQSQAQHYIDVNGISTSYEYEYMFYSGGMTKKKVARFYINFATLSLASTNDVTSTLTGCTIGNFYGGGKFGYVNGDAVSTLTDCTVTGDAFGSGFSAAVPTCEVMPLEGFDPMPSYDNDACVFNDEAVADHGYPETVTYTWKEVNNVGTGFSDEGGHYILTTEDLDHLGTVSGNATLTINGNSLVKGDVYGGGALSSSGVGTSGGKAQVNINGGTYGVVENNVATGGNIYGGGKGDVASLGEGHSDVAVTEDLVEVNIGNADQTSNNVVINGSVYGGNNINGTATNDVVVHIYKTKHNSSNMASNIGGSHAIKEVFGGGNKAHYQPTSENKKTTVHVHYCDNTIEYVYGGGNAADVGTSGTGIKSATDVIIDGGRIEWVFGGGNGYSETNNHNDPTLPNYNPGANIYGDANGNAVNVTFHAGYITYFFGGSNEWGEIIGNRNIDIRNDGTCSNLPENHIVELYGGNNKAPINNNIGITLTMPCSEDPCLIEYLFGGSRMANISGDVVLNVRGGLYNKVFGGNNLSGEIDGNVTLNLYGGTINNAAFGGNKGGYYEGTFYDGGTIMGDITVNVEDQCACPLQVNNVFGAGDLAVYTAPSGEGAREFNPMVNVNHICNNNTITGNVYGGGNGDPTNSSQELGMVTGNPKVTIGDVSTEHGSYRAAISGNVYGGGNAAKVDGTTTVLMQKANSVVSHDIYGGGNQADVLGSVVVDITNGTVSQDVYGGGALADVNGHNGTATSGATTTVTLTNGTVRNIYGGGLGSREEENEVAAKVYGDVQVTVDGGTVTDVYGCNNLNGAPQSNVQVDINNNVGGNVYGGGNLALSEVTPIVNINSGTVSGSVFGGGNQAGVGGSDVNMIGGTVVGGGVATGGTGGVFGGCNTSGVVAGNITVDITGGTIGASGEGNAANVHGGGFGQNTKTSANVEVTINQASGENPPAAPVIWGDVYGGSALGSVNSGADSPSVNSSCHTYVTMNKGTVHGDIYGGGLGQSGIEAKVWSPVQVTVNGGLVNDVYGCNNISGAPQSTVNVDIYHTDPVSTGYAIGKVFGGGNLAAYTETPVVKVHNCDNSIEYVYGGGNAANVKGTDVTIYGGNSIAHVFGGCYGANVTDDGTDVKIYGGTIDTIFGGNNVSGTIAGNIRVNVDKNGDTDSNGTATACAMYIKEVYGGGNKAASAAGEITIGCTGDLVALGTNEHYGVDQEGIRYVYGGAKEANIISDIYVKINSGNIENVFGGNNVSGNISGTIKVDIDSSNLVCGGWYVGNVYGGGNQAAYTAASNDYPEVNILSGLVSGDVFGGGLGSTGDYGKVTGNPQVTVNGAYARVNGGVYGGGSLAPTQGNPLVTLTNGALTRVYGGGKAANIIGEPTVDINGGKVSTGVYGGCDAQGNVSGKITVNVNGGTIGSLANLSSNAHITGDVFGGGYGQATTTSDNVEVNITNGTIYGDVYGGSAFGNVNATGKTTTVNVTGGTIETSTTDGTTANGQHYYIYHGGNVFGGCLGQKDDPTTSVNEAIEAKAFGKVFVNIGTGTINTETGFATEVSGDATIKGNVYGGNNQNGSPQDDVTVNIYSTHHTPGVDEVGDNGFALNNVFGGGNEANFLVGKTATINIYSCENTIERTFGGGNAAATNTVLTMIQGGRVDEAYAGGNGEVSAANINGDNTLAIHGGSVGQSFAGSNQNGIISGRSLVTIDSDGGCGESFIEEFFCGGNFADYYGDIDATIECADGKHIRNLYGGCKQADVLPSGTQIGDVHLVVRGGIYENIYGGSQGRRAGADPNNPTAESADISGSILLEIFGGTVTHAIYGGSHILGSVAGTITVNVEGDENSGCPLDIAIADVYGGGNEADYEAPVVGGVHTNYPEVNIKNATVKNVFGGGYNAKVKGNPQITIKKGSKILGNVYGGGNMGEVDGKPKVTINGQDDTANPHTFPTIP